MVSVIHKYDKICDLREICGAMCYIVKLAVKPSLFG
jgi:hypothetical protein